MSPKNRQNFSEHNAAPIRRFRLWQDETSKNEVRIELLPLIDVIFCILTFFLLAAVNLSRQQAINLDLPQAKTGTPQMRDLLIVTINDIGQLYVEQQPVTRSLLSARLEDYNETNPNGRMVLYASKNATYREVVEVLDILREVGGDRVALATVPDGFEPSESSPLPTVPQIPSIPNPNQFPDPPAPPSQN
ncbi:MAG TPA: ExbD/TolR family protein [Xenococcaceae cyanobacterium]